MSIITKVRKLLKLEKKTVSISTGFANTLGLYITEAMAWKIENEPGMDCLINHNNATNTHHDFIPNSHSFDSAHSSHDLHF